MKRSEGNAHQNQQFKRDHLFRRLAKLASRLLQGFSSSLAVAISSLNSESLRMRSKAAAAKAKQERLARDYAPWIHTGPVLDGKALASPKDWVNAVPEISATKTNVAVLIPYSPDNQQRFYRLVELP